MPPTGTPISTHERHDDTERLMSWAGFPDLSRRDTMPWYQRTAVAVVAGAVAVGGLVALVIAVVTVSDESTHPITPPARITASVTPLPAGPSPAGVAPAGPPPAVAGGPPAVAGAPPAVADAPPAVAGGPPTDAPPPAVAATLPDDLANPPTIVRESPAPVPEAAPGPDLPWWLHRLFPHTFPAPMPEPGG
jgi:hypothetical protein